MEKKSTTVRREELLKQVAIANRFVPLKPTLPVLGNLLLKVSPGQLKISATNLETSIQLSLAVKSKENWELTVPAKILNEFLTTSPGDEVVLELQKESLQVRIGETTATINGIGASEFPKLPLVNNERALEITQKEFHEAVAKVASAASVDEGKPVLTGILIKNINDKTTMVATDGYRLSRKELSTKYNLEETLINAKTLVEVLKIAGELGEEKLQMTLTPSENQAIFSGDSFLVSGRLLSGVYPSFEQIIPSKFATTSLVNKTALTEAIKSAAVFARDLGNVVKISTKDKAGLEISANTAQVGQSQAQITSENHGDPLKIAFNSRYLLDGLASLGSDTVEIKFSGALSPTLLQDPKDKSFIYIVMPVKAQN